MIRIILPAIVLASCLSPFPIHAQEDSSAPTSSQNPREKEELQARIFMAKKQYTEAAEVYNRLAQENPKDAAYYNYLGIAQLQEGKLNDARKSFDRATKVNRRFADAYNNLGATYYAEKRYKNAITQYIRISAMRILPRKSSPRPWKRSTRP